MAKKKTTDDQASQVPAKLLIPRAEAATKLDERIAAGEALRAREIRTSADLETTQHEFYTWGDYNSELLARIFSNHHYKNEYDAWGIFVGSANSTLVQEIGRLRDDIATSCRRLKSLRDRLPLIDELVDNVPIKESSIAATTRVFIVHGHDEALKLEVARFVEKLGLQAIILAEQANCGRTVIEKFEAHADGAGFAIVLLTPDDVGSAKAQQNVSLKPRARQNVVMELGYFIGALGRARVCALHKGDVELPSDIHGVVYLPADRDWKLSLAKEMKSAQLPVDLNKALD